MILFIPGCRGSFLESIFKVNPRRCLYQIILTHERLGPTKRRHDEGRSLVIPCFNIHNQSNVVALSTLVYSQ